MDPISKISVKYVVVNEDDKDSAADVDFSVHGLDSVSAAVISKISATTAHSIVGFNRSEADSIIAAGSINDKDSIRPASNSEIGHSVILVVVLCNTGRFVNSFRPDIASVCVNAVPLSVSAVTNGLNTLVHTTALPFSFDVGLVRANGVVRRLIVPPRSHIVSIHWSNVAALRKIVDSLRLDANVDSIDTVLVSAIVEAPAVTVTTTTLRLRMIAAAAAKPFVDIAGQRSAIEAPVALPFT